MSEYSDSDFEAIIEIGAMVLEQAETCFDYAGYNRDFCIQAVGSNNAVFGGTNRLLWNVREGFRCDSPYCSSDFIKGMKDIGIGCNG